MYMIHPISTLVCRRLSEEMIIGDTICPILGREMSYLSTHNEVYIHNVLIGIQYDIVDTIIQFFVFRLMYNALDS